VNERTEPNRSVESEFAGVIEFLVCDSVFHGEVFRAQCRASPHRAELRKITRESFAGAELRPKGLAQGT
jgi:hypothetical protein